MTKQKHSHRRLTRRQLARREREHRTQKLMTWIAIAVGAIIVLVLAYGSISEILKARTPAVTIGEAAIMANDFKARQSYERWMTELKIYQYQNYITQLRAQQPEATATETNTEETAPATVNDSTDALTEQLQYTVSNLEQQLSPDFTNVYAGQVLDAMIEEELVRQEAVKRGLRVSDDEIQQSIELTVGYDRTAATSGLTDAETLTDTAAALGQPDFDEVYEQFNTNVLKTAQFAEKDFRAMITAQSLKQKLMDELAGDIDRAPDQVELTVFTVDTEDEGLALKSRMNDDGEDPAVLVEELSQDESTTSAGYDLPWLPQGYLDVQFGIELEEAAFNTPVGKASQPILGTGEQYFVIYVKEHEERELSEDLLAQAEQQAYEGWLSTTKGELVKYLDWETAIVTE
ncbi:MAG: SurA N-terminal domain-containing protein [Anaerolineae bacterium]|nr:SurA N-terminal domain-containing protein [Anaerolineae bacterium]